MIARLEAGLKILGLPKQTHYELTQYDRYYAGVTINGQRRVRGRLILPPNREDNPKTGVHITDLKYLPQLRGGGCANVYVTYYVDNNLSIGQCDLTDAGVPQSEQPHWQPDDAVAARMETEIREFLHRTHSSLPDLSQYSRYYWGVTLDGAPRIRGRILQLTARETGIHLASDGDNGPVVSDGGCGNIHVEYDVESATLKRCACDGEFQMQLNKAQ